MEAFIKSHIRDIPDFPRPGIIFKDIMPLLKHHEALSRIVAALVERYRHEKIDTIVGIESRGFLFGAPLAERLGVAFVPARKEGKLPYTTTRIAYALEYGSAVIEMHTDAIDKGDRVVVVDDLLATGGTAAATCQLIDRAGGKVVECTFVVELGFLHGRQRITHAPVYSLATYS